MHAHPPNVDPMRLANATVQAVDRLGISTAEEIERAAEEVLRGATEIAEKLRDLADAIRGQSKIAHEHITGFCEKATSVLEGVRDLQARLDLDQRRAQEPLITNDRSTVPAFLTKRSTELKEQNPTSFGECDANCR